jgi:RIO kinase 2
MSWPTWKDVLTIDEEDEEDEAAEGAETKETGKETKVQFEETEEEERSAPKTGRRLDLEVEASGFGREMQRELEDVSLAVYVRWEGAD